MNQTIRPISNPIGRIFQETKFARQLSARICSKIALWLAAMIFFAGCGTTTNRIATEQLLMSDAVDRAIGQINFQSLEGKKVYLDTIYLHTVKSVGFVNAEYIISSLRQQLTAARCLIQDSRDDAEVIVEPRVGALGTDGHEVVYGIPQSGAINSAAAAFASTPMPSIPEISLGKANAQSGIAKIIVFAYDRESREPVWQSGIAKAESSSRDTWFLGAGPFQKGSIYEGMRFAGKEIQSTTMPFPHPVLAAADSEPESSPAVPDRIQFDDEYVFATDLDSIGTFKLEEAEQKIDVAGGGDDNSESKVKQAVLEKPADDDIPESK